MDVLRAFCDFQRYGPERGFLSPCREFVLITISHLVILFYGLIMLTHFLIQSPQNVSVNRVPSILFAIASGCTVLVVACQMAIPFDPRHGMPAVLLMAYSLAIAVWLSCSVAHFLAFFRHRPLPLLPCIPSAIPALIFLLISTQRWISFGPSDPRSLLTFTLLIIQSISALLPILSGKFLRRPSRDWSQLNGANGEEDGTVHETNRLVYSERKEGNWIGYIFSETFFCWTNPLLQKGYKRQLRPVEDVFELPPSLDLHALEEVRLSPNTGVATATQPGFSFAPVLLRVYGRPFALLGVLRLVGDLFKFASPVLLHLLINSLQDSASFETGYICSALMFTAMFFSSLCDFHFNYQISMLTIRAKTALLLAVYEKLLHIPAYKLTDDFSSGKLINLMSTDVERIGGFIASFHAFWSMPMNFTIALYLLYREIGLAFLAGLAISVLLIPINKYTAFKIGSFSKKMMEAKDSRMKLVNELARSMRTVKLNNLEPFFESKINTFRQKELENLKGMKYLDAVCVYLWASAPLVITVLMIYTYSAILQEQLTAAKVFTMMALVQILITPLNAFPWVLSSIVNGMVCKRRFDSFFAIQCRANSTQPIYEPMEDCGDGNLMQLQVNSFGWTEEGIPAVDSIRFSGKKGTLIGVVGPVGSGKSTLLMGLLGETTFRGPPIQMDSELLNAGFAFVGQEVWLQAGTVRDNILCGRPFKEAAFQKAVEACALQLDIQTMPGHENYRISGEGITLSGGQKVRLALARALYADKPIYLLDDPFAALDRTVAHFVYDNCVQKSLRERGKLVILCTHHEEFLREADLVIRLSSNGEVEAIGIPDEVLAEKQSQQFNLAMQSSTTEVSPMEAAEFVGVEEEEEKEEGAVKIHVYQSYFAAIGIGMCVTIFISLLAMRVSKNASDIWLSIWASNVNSGQNHSYQDWSFPFAPRTVFAIPLEQQDTTNFYLLVYVAIAALNSIFTLARAFLFAFGCILAAQRLHERILTRIMGASISWWDRTPCGRVTNRLSSDVAMVDDSLPFQLNIFLASLFALIATLLVTIVALPLLIPLIGILFVVYYFIQKYYRRTTVELKRITALSLSPLYSHLSETVSGLVSIRAFRITEQILGHNAPSAGPKPACPVLLPGLHPMADELVSVERICDYVENIPVEGGEEEEAKEAIGQLMCRRINGQIRFTGVSLRYGPELPLAIRDVSFCIEAGQRVAIVGRTGSGKSTILQALLRAHPIEAGKMFIDEVIDLESIGLKTARSLFGFVSQHPFLFSGTLRDNLCMASAQPLDDAQMEAIIAETGLAQWFRQIGGLEAEITEGGRNLSFGERQLISLLRLALTRPRIVLIDEATAHMDERTHTLMGRLIGGMGCTLVAIVHRLNGLDNFDWVIEMSQGQIARQGPPALFAAQQPKE